MAGNLLNKYGTNNQAITITLASLGSTSQRQSTAIDNTSNTFIDALVFLIIKTGASGTTSTGFLNVYAFGTADGGTNYSDNAGASDAAITLTAPPNMRLIGSINAVANATTYKAGPFSVAAAFGGTLPDHWGIVVDNETGHALDATSGNFSVFYQGVEGQYT
jgi:hypothetical protein